MTTGCAFPRFLFWAHDCVLSYRYSVVVEGERGNRPHIYCLEQLLQEAVSTPHCPTHRLLTHIHVTAHHNRPVCFTPGTLLSFLLIGPRHGVI